MSTQSSCIYRPRAPGLTMNPAPPTVSTTTVTTGTAATGCGVKKDCGFPWWVVFLLIGLVVLALIWAWWKNNHNNTVKNPAQLGSTPAVVGEVGEVEEPVVGDVADIGPTFVAINNQNKVIDVCQTSYLRPNKNSKVKGGNSNTIAQLLQNRTPALVMLTMDKCQFCDVTEPELDVVSRNVNIGVYEINKKCITNKNDLPKGYPYIMVILPDGSIKSFQGRRSAKNLIEFVRNNLGDKFVKPEASQIQ